MNINLRQLRAFVSIGRLGSFTKAAEALHATQPALSAQIRELEEALGVKLVRSQHALGDAHPSG